LLCVDCNLKVQQAADLQHARNVSVLNHLVDQMEAQVGIYGVLPRYQVPQPTIQAGPVTHHNIQIHGSVIGTINTGNIQKMNVALDRVTVGGAPELATVLQKLTEAVLASSELSPAQKTKAVDHLSFITDQAALPTDKRNASIGTTILEGFERVISTSSGVLAIWQTAKPLIESLF